MRVCVCVCVCVYVCVCVHVQVRCVRHECPSGTYLDILSAPSGVLPSGTGVCRPCHEYCALCYGPSPMECPQCVYARRGSECVTSNNGTYVCE